MNNQNPLAAETGNLARGCLLYLVMLLISIAIVLLCSISLA